MAHDESLFAKLDRRGFLRLVGGGAVAVATGGIAGCGGGSGGNGGGGGIPVGTLSEDERYACLDALQTFLDSIGNLPLDEQAAQALSFMRSRPEFVDSDIDEDGVWAIFVDGLPFMLLLNREPESNPIAGTGDSGGRAPNDMPDNSTAMLINTLSALYADEVSIIKPMLQSYGYSTIIDPGSVESLRVFNDDGIFYYSAHSGVVRVPLFNPDGTFRRASPRGIQTRREFGVWTSTPILRNTANLYIDDMRQGRLGFGQAHHGTGQPGSPRYALRYWITAAFVNTYMNFGQDSLVWFSSCNSNGANSQPFVQACINAGAGLYVGWNRSAGDAECVAVGKFIFDRLLGSNIHAPLENPLQRPFEYVKVWQEMAARGLPSGLVYKVGSGNFGLLAPTIAYVLINEFDEEAHLYGIFGNPASADRKVTIGGTPVTVKSWTPDIVVVNLPQSGAGSSGNVEVEVRGHKSNVRQITEWRIDMSFDWIETAMPPLTTSGIFTLYFRADVGHYRDQPGLPPLEPIRWAVAKKDSTGVLEATGSASADCVHTWSGIAQYAPGGFQPPPDHMIVTRMKIDTDTQTGALGLSIGDLTGPPFTYTLSCPKSPPIVDPFTVTFGLLGGEQDFFTPRPGDSVPVSLPALPLTFSSDYKIPSIHYIDDSPTPIKLEVRWPQVVPASPPDPNAARGRA